MAEGLAVIAASALLVLLARVTTALIHEPVSTQRLIADGLIFVAAMSFGQVVGWALAPAAGLGGAALGALLLAMPAAVFAITTLRPPRTHQLDGGYGMTRRDG